MTTTLADDTVVGESSSQEDILAAQKGDRSGIQKTTEVQVKYGAGDSRSDITASQKADNPHFPHQNPFAPR